MASYLGRLAALAAVIIPAIFAAPAPQLKIRNPDAQNVVPDSYIVVYNDNVNASTIASHMSSVTSMLSRRDLTGIGAVYDMAMLKGFQVTADATALAEIAAAPEVAYVEKDARVYASDLISQDGAPYGLGRISHQSPGSNTYIYDSSAGSGVTIYVVDTGIYIGHSEFGGRASWGTNFIKGSKNTDENGHGTHCSGTIAGSTYGVAKNANLVAVKVLDRSGSGTNSGVISGIQWVGNNAGPQSVLSMSLGGSYSSAVNSAVRSTVNRGVTVVVAAGNDNADAGNYSPASEPSAIAVGAIDSNDNRASFSNYGDSVAIFAPGVNVLSSWIGSSTATNTISGTSMATPHIAGLAAYLIALQSLASPADVLNSLQSLATSGLVVNANSVNNLIGYNGNGA